MTFRRSFLIATTLVLACAALPALSRAQVAEWTLREEVRVGAGASVAELPRIARLVTSPDGRVYALAGSGELLIFDRAGTLLRRMHTVTPEQVSRELREHAESTIRALGRLGPEATIRWHQVPSASRGGLSHRDVAAGWVGDTLWLGRNGLSRLALFNGAGDSIGTISFTPEIDGRGANAPLAMLSDGSLLRTITPSTVTRFPAEGDVPPPPGRYQMPVIPGPPLPPRNEEPARGFLLRATPDGRVLQGLEIFVQPRRPVVVRNPYGVTATVETPFEDHPLVAVTPDGSEVVFVERYRAERPGQASFVVVRFDTRTGKRTARPYSYAPTPITGATWDSLYSSMIDSAGGPVTARFLDGFPSTAAARSAILRPLDIGKFHAPVTDLVAGADRTVWLREHATGAWIVLGRDGEMLGRVRLPAGAQLLHGDAGSVWALEGDGPGRTSTRALIRYRIEKP